MNCVTFSDGEIPSTSGLSEQSKSYSKGATDFCSETNKESENIDEGSVSTLPRTEKNTVTVENSGVVKLARSRPRPRLSGIRTQKSTERESPPSYQEQSGGTKKEGGTENLGNVYRGSTPRRHSQTTSAPASTRAMPSRNSDTSSKTTSNLSSQKLNMHSRILNASTNSQTRNRAASMQTPLHASAITRKNGSSMPATKTVTTTITRETTVIKRTPVQRVHVTIPKMTPKSRVENIQQNRRIRKPTVIETPLVSRSTIPKSTTSTPSGTPTRNAFSAPPIHAPAKLVKRKETIPIRNYIVRENPSYQTRSAPGTPARAVLHSRENIPRQSAPPKYSPPTRRSKVVNKVPPPAAGSQRPVKRSTRSDIHLVRTTSTTSNRQTMKRADSCSTAARPSLIKTGSLTRPDWR